jgi:hypothetical protein
MGADGRCRTMFRRISLSRGGAAPVQPVTALRIALHNVKRPRRGSSEASAGRSERYATCSYTSLRKIAVHEMGEPAFSPIDRRTNPKLPNGRA